MVNVVPDTNFFLHYKSIDLIEWSAIFGEEPVTIWVPMNTVRELDKQKDRGETAGIQKRLLKALQFCLKAIDGPVEVKSNITLRFRTEEPKSFSQHHLDKDLPDDRLVCAAVELSETIGEKVILLTHDTTPRIKTKNLRLEPMDPPEAWKLPNSS